MSRDPTPLAGLTAILDHLAVGLIVGDSDGNVLHLNPIARRMHGFAGVADCPRRIEEFAERFDVRDLDGSPLPVDRLPLSRVLAGEELQNCELTVRERATGRERVFLCDGAVAVEDGRRLAVLTLVDVSERRRAEAALRESEERFRQLAEAMPQLVWTARPDGRVDYYNGRVREYAGFERRTDGTWGWEPVVHPDQAAATMAAWTRALATGEPYQFEHQVRLRGGEYRWHLSRGVPARDAEGRIVKWFGTATDIDDAIRAAESARQQAQLLDMSHDAILVWELDGVIEYWNRGAEELYGYAAGEAVGRDAHELLACAPATSLATVRASLERDRTWVGELIHRGRTGRVLVVDSRLVLVERAGRRLVLEINRDVTQRKQDDEERFRSEERFRRLVEASAQIVWVVEPGGVTLEDSASWRAFTGRSYEEYAGWRRLEAIHPDDREAILSFWRRSGAVRQSTTLAFRLLNAAGEYRHMECWAVPVPDRDGRVREWIVMGSDVTERLRAERERLELERGLQHADKLQSLGVLAGGVAHDFNNILTSVLGNADLLLMDLAEDSPARELVHEIRTAATRAADLSRQMLAYTGKGRVAAQALDLAEVVREISRLLEATISKKAALDVRLGETPPVAGDATQIRQVVMNLLTNASEALGGKSGRISLATRVQEFDAESLELMSVGEKLAPGRYVVVEVADTGCGMDDATRARIFEPFFSTKFTGRGLGLAAVMGIVRAHRGGIRVESQPGEGTTVTVILPPGGRAAARRRPPAVVPAWRGEGTVLLVDDEPIVRSIGERMLRKLGFDVLLAAGGREAVEILARRVQDVRCVILDLTMPELDGEQTLPMLRQLRADLPVILASGYDPREAMRRFADADLAGFLQKPFTVRTLVARLRDALAEDVLADEAPGEPEWADE